MSKIFVCLLHHGSDVPRSRKKRDLCEDCVDSLAARGLAWCNRGHRTQANAFRPTRGVCRACEYKESVARAKRDPKALYERTMAWRRNNPERHAEHKRAYYERTKGRPVDPERARTKRQRWRERHPEQAKAINANYRARNREKVQSWQAAYRLRRKLRILQSWRRAA